MDDPLGPDAAYNDAILETLKFQRAESESAVAQWSEEFGLRSGGEKSIHNFLPHLFLAAFPTVDPVVVSKFSLACAYIGAAALALDPVYDGHAGYADGDASRRIARGQILLFEQQLILSDIFPRTASYWSFHRRFYNAHFQTMLTEREFANGRRPLASFDISTARTIAVGKSAMMRLAIAMLGSVSGEFEIARGLDRSLCRYIFARQMFDDLQDWKTDLAARLPSLLLARVVKTWPSNSDGPPDLRLLAKRIHTEGHSRVVLAAARTELDEALADAVAAPRWSDELLRLRDVVDRASADIDAVLNAARSRKAASSASSSMVAASSDRQAPPALWSS